MSVAERALHVVDGGAPSAEGEPWADVLAAALRPEFTVYVYYPERGEPILFGHACAVEAAQGVAAHTLAVRASAGCAALICKCGSSLGAPRPRNGWPQASSR